MSKPQTNPNLFAAATTGTTVQLDADFATLYTALNDFNTYSNYLVDSGVANAYVVTLAANLTLTLSAGLMIQFKAANANTGASTLNANSTGVKNILNLDGTALSAGQIPLNAIVLVQYDGTQYLLLTPSVSSTTIPGQFNFNFNGDFEIWGSGASAAPTGWTLVGAGGTVAKNTTAGQFKYTLASAALTRSGTDVTLSQDIDLISGFGPVGVWQGKTLTFGCWVRATVAGRAIIEIDDGVTTTDSSAHSGGSGLEFLTVTKTLAGGATRVRILCKVQTGDTTAQFDGAVLVRGSSVSDFIPSGWRGRKSVVVFTSTAGGTIAAATTAFMNSGGSDATEANIYQPTPFKCVLRNLRVSSTAAPGVGQTFIYTLRDSGAGTNLSLTATISGTNIGASDTTDEAVLSNSVTGILGIYSLRVVTSAGAAATHHFGSVEIEETPF